MNLQFIVSAACPSFMEDFAQFGVLHGNIAADADGARKHKATIVASLWYDAKKLLGTSTQVTSIYFAVLQFCFSRFYFLTRHDYFMGVLGNGACPPEKHFQN